MQHPLLRHGLVFMPHGENLVMVLRDHVPVRMVMKDVGEEVALMTDPDVAAADRPATSPTTPSWPTSPLGSTCGERGSSTVA